jgi:hypothetical protein
MADDDPAIPAPRAPEDDVTGPPGTRRAWTTALGQVSGLLLTLREEELSGTALPEVLADGTALRAWSVLTRPVLRDPERVTLPHARPEDLAVLGRAARVLGASLCRWRASGAADVVTAVLHSEAAMHDREPEWLVAQLARIHGVLSAPGPVSAWLVWRALDDGGASTASWGAEAAGS